MRVAPRAATRVAESRTRGVAHVERRAVGGLSMRRGALVAGAIVLLLLAPVAAADLTVQVATTGDRITYAPDTFPQRYTFNPVDPPFNVTAPLNAFGVETTQDLGTVDAKFYFGVDRRVGKSSIVLYEVSNATVTRTVMVETKATYSITQAIHVEQNVYLDGVHRWSQFEIVGFGSRANVSATSLVGWAADNLTAFTSSQGPSRAGPNGTAFATAPATAQSGGHLYFIPFNQASLYFDNIGNGTDASWNDLTETHLFELGEMQDVTGVVVVTPSLENERAESLRFHWLFLTKEARNVRAAEMEENVCGGVKAAVKLFLGFCPTVETLVGYIAERASIATTKLFERVPGLDGISTASGTLVGLIVGLYAFVFVLVFLSPVKVAVVVFGHITFYALLVAAWEGRPSLFPHVTWRALRGTGIFLYYYSAVTFYTVKFALTLLMRGVQAAGQWVRG